MTFALDERLGKYFHAVRYRLFSEPIRSFFMSITSFDRRLFAIQRYVSALRSPGQGRAWVDSRWAMTRDEFREWHASPEGILRDRELHTIIARFNAANPGFRLVAGSQFRPLEVQRHSWDRHPTVGLHSATLLTRARREIGDEDKYPDLGPYLIEAIGLLSHIAAPAGGMPGVPPGMLRQTLRALPGATDGSLAVADRHDERDKAIDRFVQWLAIRRRWRPTIMIATPGLSNHGVGHAIDFEIHRRGAGMILGASSAGTWSSSGWAARLAAAVGPSRHFTGPLRDPDEPWHWTFDATP